MSPDSKECPPPKKKSGGGGGGLPPFETIRFETFISFLLVFVFMLVLMILIDCRVSVVPNRNLIPPHPPPPPPPLSRVHTFWYDCSMPQYGNWNQDG